MRAEPDRKQWSVERVQEFLDEMQRELLDSRVHSYLELYVPAPPSDHRSEETLGMPELTMIQVRCLWSKTGRIIGTAGLGLVQHRKPEEEHEKQKQYRDRWLWPGRRVTTFDTQIICPFSPGPLRNDVCVGSLF